MKTQNDNLKKAVNKDSFTNQINALINRGLVLLKNTCINKFEYTSLGIVNVNIC